MILTLSIYINIDAVNYNSPLDVCISADNAFLVIDFNIDDANMMTWLKRNSFIMVT